MHMRPNFISALASTTPDSRSGSVLVYSGVRNEDRLKAS